MVVSEAIKLLKNSELKQLGIKEDTNAILGFLNLGILELHKRFPLREDEAIITQVTGVNLYTLDGNDNNVSISLSDNDLLVIKEAYDEDNLLYNIRNERSDYSIYAPSYNKIKVVTVINGDTIRIVYKSSPIFLTDTKDIIPVPQPFLEALFLYVGYKGQGSIKSGIKDENNTHFIRFEASCQRINTEGLYIQTELESNKFEQRGFV